VSRRPAELIIEGRVGTLAGDRGFGWAEALALGEGRVLATGTAAEVGVLAGPATVRWRLPADQLVMPAITDAHLHLLMLVAGRTQVDVSAAADMAATLALLAVAHRRLADAGDSDGWLLGHGWSPSLLGGWPTTADLERACPDRPVALYAHDHHSRWVSAIALRLAGIDDATADPPGGVIRRDESGAATGILHENAANLVDAAIPETDPARLAADLVAVAAELAALGVVGCHDPAELDTSAGIGRSQLLYRELAAAGLLPLRVHAAIRAHQLDQAIAAGMRSGEGVAPADDNADPRARRLAERYRFGWLKLFVDGSLGSRSALLLEPYSDAAAQPPTGGPRGMYQTPVAELAELLRKAWRGGISGQLHAIGDGAVRLALDLLADQPTLPLMPRIEHAQLVDPADVPRFGQLGVAASVQPVHLRSDADIARRAWGERAELAFPLAGLVAGGALIPCGTDAPVEAVHPWPGIAVAVARRDPFRPSDQPLGAGHALDLARAIRGACLDPALVAGQQDLGRLVVGYRADLLVVPAAGFAESLDAAVLAATRPLATLLDGEVIYRAPAFDPAVEGA
jgi:hypothetical protein